MLSHKPDREPGRGHQEGAGSLLGPVSGDRFPGKGAFQWGRGGWVGFCNQRRMGTWTPGKARAPAAGGGSSQCAEPGCVWVFLERP